MSRFLQFDSLTLCHIDAVTIIREEFLQEDIDWPSTYHEGVFGELAPYLDDEKNGVKTVYKYILTLFTLFFCTFSI